MVRVSFLRPIDQFDGTQRLIDELRTCLRADEYEHLRFSVAFAITGPLLRLAADIRAWRAKGHTIRAIFGIDLDGTSKQVLEFALHNFDQVYITHSTSNATFHPKFYLFFGDESAVCYQGSNNLTVGGTETNLEGAVKVKMDRPADEATFQEALSSWESLLPVVCPLTLEVTQELIDDLFARGLIFDETVAKPRRRRAVATTPGTAAGTTTRPFPFPRTHPKPPSPIPREELPAAAPAATGAAKGRSGAAAKRRTPLVVPSEALVIQIVPHDNGEVFLSKRAVDQNPAFFGFPFTGRTTPKNPRNSAYPQRDPDPVVNVTVYDRRGNPRVTANGFNLNTVFYQVKSEIRVTFSPELRRATAPYSIMVMRRSEEEHDYDIEIFNPGSDLYREYLDACNQTLPGGGKAQPRRMGWL